MKENGVVAPSANPSEEKEVEISNQSCVENEPIKADLEENNTSDITLGGRFISAKELLESVVEDEPFLVEGLIQSVGLFGLIGGSDLGKSALLQQLCLDVVKGTDFLGFKTNGKHKKAIYLSTEDGPNDIYRRLHKRSVGNPSDVEGVQYMFDGTDFEAVLKERLERGRIDLVVVDVFTDIYTGDMNMTSKIRHFLQPLHNMAQKYKCAIGLNHHTSKNGETKMPHKDNAIGSTGFEGKLRLVMEMRRDSEVVNQRHLCVVKCNYIRDVDKDSSYVLSFNDDMSFTNTGERRAFSTLVKPKVVGTDYETPKARARELRKEGKTLDVILDTLKKEGFNIGRTAIADAVKDISKPTKQAVVKPSKSEDKMDTAVISQKAADEQEETPEQNKISVHPKP